MPKWMLYVILLSAMVAMLPPALIAQKRNTRSEKPRIHIIQDMDNQVKMQAQQTTPLFLDSRVMREPVQGAVAQETIIGDPFFTQGIDGDNWGDGFPAGVNVDRPFIMRGQERFNIYCSPCHGPAGFGDGIIHHRAMQLLERGAWGTVWVQPTSMHDPTVTVQPNGQLFNTITHGVRTMPSYARQIPAGDRWAIIAYVRALQRSQNAGDADLPEGVTRGELEVIPAPPLPAEGEDDIKPETEADTPEMPGDDSGILDSGATAP